MFEPTVESTPETASKITQRRAPESTQANAGSRRTHLLIMFNDLTTTAQYGRG